MAGAEHRFKGRIIADNLIVGELKQHVKKIHIEDSDLGAAEVDTSWDLPTACIVHDVWVDVNTAEATGTTKTLDIGILSTETDGDADGFLDGVSVAATGIVRGVPTFSDGSNLKHVASTTRGALLRVFEAGSDANNNPGTHYNRDHIGSSTGVSVSVTSGSSDFADLDADIYIWYSEILSL